MSNVVLVLKGLPASGKTTFARELVSDQKANWKRINKDDIRDMLDNGIWSRDNESMVIQIRNMILSLAMANSYNVIIDDTNINPVHVDFFDKYVQTHNKLSGNQYVVQIQEFDTPLEDCILRDSRRPFPVGEQVIRNMHAQMTQQPIDAPKLTATTKKEAKK